MSESVFNTKVYASVARKAQAEGIVMLENRDNALPLKKLRTGTTRFLLRRAAGSPCSGAASSAITRAAQGPAVW